MGPERKGLVKGSNRWITFMKDIKPYRRNWYGEEKNNILDKKTTMKVTASRCHYIRTKMTKRMHF